MIDKSKDTLDLVTIMGDELANIPGLKFLDVSVAVEAGLRFRATSEDHPGEKLVVFIPWNYQQMATRVACEFKHLLESRPKYPNAQQNKGQIHAYWRAENDEGAV